MTYSGTLISDLVGTVERAEENAQPGPRQQFYTEEADQLFPEGCRCQAHGGGDCDWCRVYYGGPGAEQR